MGGKMSKLGQLTPNTHNQRTEDPASAGGKNKENSPTKNHQNSEDPISQLTNFTISLLHVCISSLIKTLIKYQYINSN